MRECGCGSVLNVGVGMCVGAGMDEGNRWRMDWA